MEPLVWPTDAVSPVLPFIITTETPEILFVHCKCDDLSNQTNSKQLRQPTA